MPASIHDLQAQINTLRAQLETARAERAAGTALKRFSHNLLFAISCTPMSHWPAPALAAWRALTPHEQMMLRHWASTCGLHNKEDAG